MMDLGGRHEKEIVALRNHRDAHTYISSGFTHPPATIIISFIVLRGLNPRYPEARRRAESGGGGKVAVYHSKSQIRSP